MNCLKKNMKLPSKTGFSVSLCVHLPINKHSLYVHVGDRHISIVYVDVIW